MERTTRKTSYRGTERILSVLIRCFKLNWKVEILICIHGISEIIYGNLPFWSISLHQ